MRSIRSYLIWVLVGAVSVVMLGSVIASYNEISHETEELYDAELAQTARVLETLLSIQFGRSEIGLQDLEESSRIITPPAIHSREEFDNSGHKYEKKLAFEVRTRKGVLLLGGGGPDAHLSFSALEGYGAEQSAGIDWRTFVLYSDALNVWIKVAQRVEIREELTHEVASTNAGILLLSLPIMVLLIAWLVRRGFRPLLAVTNEVSTRGPNHLEPIRLCNVPDEVGGVVVAINRLLAGLDSSLQRQRRFTSNAAHELRTPLAAIKIHAQNLLADDERTARIQKSIVQGIDKLTHMFNQLITLSRLESSTDQGALGQVELRALTDELLTDMAPLHRAKNITIEQQVKPEIAVSANREALAILLRNLLDNALRYTPEGGRVWLALEADASGTTLFVSDNGQGLDDQQKQLVFDRFYRAAGQDSTGCGIGLSIVQEICDTYGYRIRLSDSRIDTHGLTVAISFNR